MTAVPCPAEGIEHTSTREPLLLFVADDEPNSRLAKENLARLRESLPAHRYEIEIIDVFVDFQPALEHQILVTPCLLLPETTPPVRVVGTLSDTEAVRRALRIPDEYDVG